MAWLAEKIDAIVKDTIRDEGPRIVNSLITPEYVHGIMREVFEKDPNRQLTCVGFGNAMALSLNDIWRDIPFKECARLMWEYLSMAGIRYDDPDYSWSYSAAQDLAREYAETYGEAA